MIKLTQEIEKVDGLINKLKIEFEKTFYQELEAQKADHLVEARTEGPSLPHDQCSRLTSLKDIEQKNRLLTMSIEKRCKHKEELYNLGIELLQKKDEMKKNLSDREIMAKKMWDYRLEVIKNSQSNLASLHTMKSNLQIIINAELTQIASQFETDLQNLQKSYNEKTSELESVQPELTALTKSVQQEETKRQELQDQLDKLAPQANTTRHEMETITQELEGHRQKLEESRNALAAAEQKKRQLETQIEQAKKDLKKKEKELKHAESEYKKGENAFKNAGSSLEEAIIKKNQQKSALAEAEKEKKALERKYLRPKEIKFFEGYVETLKSVLNGDYSRFKRIDE
jgi:chromosome segregation ATPase